MQVLMLGTGAADGWPNPFCTCASCDWARSSGTVRTTTSALVDDVLLLDCGPDAPRQAARAGRSLAGLRAVLVTHAHPDHLDPAALLARSWARPASALQVVGPRSVMSACEHWIGPDDSVALTEVSPGDVLTIDGYVVRVLAAAHDVGHDSLTADAVLYEVTAPDGGRLLYATDTAALPQATVDALRDVALDLLLVEQTFGAQSDHGTGHLDLATLPAELRRLREAGAVTDSTDVVAVHLSHHNPPGPELARVLAPWGVRVVDDLTALHVGRSTPVAHRALPRRTLLLGGARSGKSHEAERMLAATSDVEYVATGGAREDDAEWAERIALHRARRPATWTTVETLDVAKLLQSPGPSAVLVDCLSLWLAGALDAAGAWASTPGSPERAAAMARVDSEIAALVDAVRRTTRTVVLVSNEVGSGVVPEHESGRIYRDLLGRLNARVAAECDAVSLVVAGTVLPLTPGSSAAAP